MYGYGKDAYFITDEQEALLNEFIEKGAKIIRELRLTDYNNREITIKDIDGRWNLFPKVRHSNSPDFLLYSTYQ